jgi:hypothetical protein
MMGMIALAWAIGLLMGLCFGLYIGVNNNEDLEQEITGEIEESEPEEPEEEEEETYCANVLCKNCGQRFDGFEMEKGDEIEGARCIHCETYSLTPILEPHGKNNTPATHS